MLDRCSVRANTATLDAGGLYVYGAATVRDSTFSGNGAARGGGRCLSDPRSEFDIERCVITGNEAMEEGGGVYCGSANPRLKGCLIAGNSAGVGGGIYAENYSAPHLINCTLAANSARLGAGGGLYLDLSECGFGIPDIAVNSILWNNVPDQIASINPNCTPEVSWCDVMGGWTGPGNIDATPEFVWPSEGATADYRLLSISPCIDAGSNGAAAGILTDLDGNLRIWDGDDVPGAAVDMGAYEFGSVSPTPTPTRTYTPTPTATPTPVPGDANGDLVVDALDLFFFSQSWKGLRNETNFRCDTYSDGIIDEHDLFLLISEWR